MAAPTSSVIIATNSRVTINNQEFTSVGDAIVYAAQLQDSTAKRTLFEQIAHHIQSQRSELQEYASQLETAIQNDPEMLQVVTTSIDTKADGNSAMWLAIRKGHASQQELIRRRNNLAAAITSTFNAQASRDFMTLLQDATVNQLKTTAALFRQHNGTNHDSWRALLRDVIFDRLNTPRQGSSTVRRVLYDDLKKAFEKAKAREQPRAQSYYLSRNYIINVQGLVESAPAPDPPVDIQGPRIQEVDDDDDDNVGEQSLITTGPQHDDGGAHIYDEDQDEESTVENVSQNVSQPGADKDSGHPTSSTSDPTTKTTSSKRRIDDDDGPDSESDHDDDAAAPTSKRPRRHESSDIADDETAVQPESEEEDVDEVEEKDTVKLKCNCHAKVPSDFKAAAISKIPAKDNSAQHKLVRRFITINDKGHTVCFKHTHATAGNAGFQVKKCKHKDLLKNLKDYVTALDAGQLPDYKKKRGLFRKTHRPVLASDGLGPYRFAHDAKLFNLTADMQTELQDYLNVDMDAWEKDGSVNMSCFDWMQVYRQSSFPAYEFIKPGEKDLSVHDVVLQEMDMYRYHQRLVNGKPNMGWLRNMLHSLGQQAMRMSLRYYAIYCALRPDRNHRLVSYPYYAKYQTADDGTSTFFRHIDIAIDAAVRRDRGIHAIQGTLSLDDEESNDCTEILPGMHNNLKEWHANLKSRGALSDALSFVSRITDSNFNAQDKAQFKTDWTPVPCKALEVRITDPRLPHGAQTAKGTRRTMLPWFCGVDEDGSLEMPEAGTAEELANAHRDLGPAGNTPSGLANRYSTIPYPFPAAVHLPCSNVIAQSVVGRVNLDNYALNYAKAQFFTDSDHRDDAIAANEEELALNVFRMWEMVKDMEMNAFGKDKSYFLRIERGLSVEWDKNDPSANDDDFAHEVPHGGTLQDEDGQDVMVGSDTALDETGEGNSDEDAEMQRAIARSYQDVTGDTVTATAAVQTTPTASQGVRRSARLRTAIAVTPVMSTGDDDDASYSDDQEEDEDDD